MGDRVPGHTCQGTKPVNVQDGGIALCETPTRGPTCGEDPPSNEQVCVSILSSEGRWVPVAYLAKGVRELIFFTPASDPQGRQILELWLGGLTDEVTFASDDWGNYMRAEPDLQTQINAKLQADADNISKDDKWEKAHLPTRKDYYGRFHGEVGHYGFMGGPSGGYFTGYQLLHGSKHCYTRMTPTGVREVKLSEGNESMPKLRDVEIIGKVAAGGSPYTVTFEDLHFMWNDIANPNAHYGADARLAKYGAFENKYTCHRPPRDYVLHITWEATAPVTFKYPILLAAQG